jgi:hypothetical protein
MDDNGLATTQLGSASTTYKVLSYFNKPELVILMVRTGWLR